jgi:hypothetical protein
MMLRRGLFCGLVKLVSYLSRWLVSWTVEVVFMFLGAVCMGICFSHAPPLPPSRYVWVLMCLCV